MKKQDVSPPLRRLRSIGAAGIAQAQRRGHKRRAKRLHRKAARPRETGISAKAVAA